MSGQQGFGRGGGGGWSDPEMDAEKVYGPRRFWMPKDTEAKGVFLDTEPFTLDEHQVELNGTFTNWFTCLGNWNEPCPICDADKDPYRVAMLTILSFYKHEKSNQWRAVKNLFPMRQQTFKIMAEYRKDRKGDLTGWVFKAIRRGEKSANVGNSFDFQRKIEGGLPGIVRELTGGDGKPNVLAWLATQEMYGGAKRQTPEQYVVPIDYDAVFAKPTEQALMRVARRIIMRKGMTSSGGAGTDAGTGDGPSDAGDDIPF